MPDHTRESVWVVVPCYNEGPRLSNVLAQLVSCAHSVVVVDDGSTTPVAGIERFAGVSLLRHCVNLGQGAALQTGIDYALQHGADYVVTFDSDGQHSASDIAAMLAPLRDGSAQVTLGTRFAGGGRAIGIPPLRAFVLRTAIAFTRRTTGLKITDTHNGLRALTREAVARLRITQNRMAHASQILSEIARLELRYTEVPVTIRYSEESLAKGQRMSNAFNVLWESMSGIFAR